jgi:DNA-binding winged helix-turn-helix (wHTH) protein
MKGECRMNNESEILFPPFRLDLLREKLWCGGEVISLRPKTFAILRYLAEHPERLVSKAELLRAIWGETHVSEEGLRDYIREIRKALNDNPAFPRFVETALGRGYRFVGTAASSQYSVVSRRDEAANEHESKGKENQLTKASPLLTVRGVYDGKVVKVLPTESLPPVSREVSVAILFLEDALSSGKKNALSKHSLFIHDTTTVNGHLKNSPEEQ